MNFGTRRYVDLLRHGATEGGGGYRGSTDDRLTPAGVAQMRDAVADRNDWDLIVTSPLLRCAQFAHDFAEHRALPLEIDPRLREMHFGEWEGRTAEQLLQTEPAALRRFWDDPWRYPPPGGDTMEALAARVRTAWREITARGRRVLVVSHGGPMRIILCDERGLPPRALLQVEVAHASLHRIDVSSRVPLPSDVAT